MDKLKQNVILFDLDGTITDSAPGVIKCMQYSLEQCGMAVPEEKDLFFIVGPPLMDTYRGAFQMEEEQAEQAYGLYRERYEKKGMYENSLFDGIEDMLAELKKKGKRLGIATSKAQDFAELIIEHFGIGKYFDFIAGCDSQNLTERNTKAKVIQYALESMQADKSDSILIGDRKYDIIGAKEVGIPVVGVEYGYAERSELEEYGADYIVPEPRDVAELF